jgi:hypothetical protein
MPHTNALEVLGEAIMNWDHDLEDVFVAVRAADTQAKFHQKDVYIMHDLSIILPEHAKEPPLEVIRYLKIGKGFEH